MFIRHVQPALANPFQASRKLRLALGVVAACVLVAQGRSPLWAQSSGEAVAEKRLKVVEKECEDLKKQNESLAEQVQQLKAKLDMLIHETRPSTAKTPAANEPPSDGAGPAIKPGDGGQPPLGRPYWDLDRTPTASPGGIAPSGAPGIGPYRLPMVPPFGIRSEIVSLAGAYSDALSEAQAARRQAGGPGKPDAAAAADRLQKAERKVGLLRKIIETMRDEAAEEAERAQRLAKAGAIPTALLKDRETRVKLLELILAEDAKPAK